MSFSSWLRNWKSLPPRPPIRRARPVGRKGKLPLSLELLEDRLALSVTTLVNRAEYLPGETVGITAAGLTPGNTVEFRMSPAQSTASATTWQITDGGIDDLDGGADGSIRTVWP